MRVLALFSLVAAGLAAEFPAPGSQRGLLVLPKPGPAVYTSQYQNDQQTPEILSPRFAERRGVYFVEVPQERIQALLAKTEQVSEDTQSFFPARYNEQPDTPVNVRYLPLQEAEVTNFGSSSQYRAAEPTFEATVRYVSVPLEK